ncbi:MAG TPA: glycosyl hydrolase 115 family protein, partial [Anaerolineales bacterium]|nr:glycosyl hydrolase 115 family protein [Anaerolineales bacterium]
MSTGPQTPFAAYNKAYITSENSAGCFPLSVSGQAAPLYVSGEDFPGVLRIARLFQADIGRVTGTKPELLLDDLPSAKEMILIGTLGHSPIIDQLVQERKLDITDLIGKWETSLLQVVEKPLSGVERALVLAGSDKRGTLYGMFDLSARIGVSPWYWWADVPVRQQPDLFVRPGRHTQGEPAIRYRGIFINDEAPALTKWAHEKFGGLNHRFYENVFELILRLKGNYLWPAMWNNAFHDDDPVNPQLADEYGIVIGTSHHEPMMRAHAEWSRYGTGSWNYTANKAVLKKFWEEGVRGIDAREVIVTLGMRGDGDMPMTAETDIALLERIIRDQRQIIAHVT